MRLRAVAVVCAAVACAWAASCAFPEYRFRGEPAGDAAIDTTIVIDSGAPPDVADTSVTLDTRVVYDAPDPTMCPSSKEVPPCAPVEPAPIPIGTLDGKGDELCAHGVRRFSVRNGERRFPETPPAGVPQQIEVRIGLNAVGVTVHVRVSGDPRILVAPAGSAQLDNGDAVEIYLRGHKRFADGGKSADGEPLTGSYDEDGVRHVVIAPPIDGQPARAAFHRNDVRKGDGFVDPSWWTARVVKDGYEVELKLPWSEIPWEVDVGDTMGFDVAIDVDDDPTIAGREFRSVMSYREIKPSPSCAGGVPEAWCDDRTWCLLTRGP